MYMKNGKVYLQTSADVVRAYTDPSIDWYKTDICPRKRRIKNWLNGVEYPELRGFNESISHWDTSNIRVFWNFMIWLDDFDRPIPKDFFSKARSLITVLAACSSFNHSIAGLDLREAKTIDGFMVSLDNFNSDISGIRFKKLKHITDSFQNLTVFDSPLGSMDFKSARTVSVLNELILFNQPVDSVSANHAKVFGCFNSCDKFNQPVSSIDLRKADRVSIADYSPNFINQILS